MRVHILCEKLDLVADEGLPDAKHDHHNRERDEPGESGPEEPGECVMHPVFLPSPAAWMLVCLAREEL